MVQVMGILNVTPDSFYDGGRYSSWRGALLQAKSMVAEGANFLDVGGESTRPGAEPVSVAVEIKRVVPIVRAIAKKFPRLPISIDTQKSAVALAALEAGARIVNDVSALRFDPKMAEIIKKKKAGVILMHMRQDPSTMQVRPRYGKVVQEVVKFLAQRAQWAIASGIAKHKIWIDPGIGFGKTVKHNLALIRQIHCFVNLGYPVLVGHSRKSFIGKILDQTESLPATDRLEGSLAVACYLAMNGASILRVHDVGATLKAVRVTEAILKKEANSPLT